LNIDDAFLKFALLGAEWVLWLLVILSVVSIGVMIERLVYFLRGWFDMVRATKLLRSRLDEGGGRDAREAFEKSAGSPEVRILLAGMEREDDGVQAVEEAMGARRAVEKVLLEKNLSFLGTLGPTAPFIGLFGTVLGIIGAFHNLATNPQGGIGVVMTQLSEALVATAAGLLVAIPAVVLYNVFMRAAQRKITNANVLSGLYLSWLQGRAARDGGDDG